MSIVRLVFLSDTHMQHDAVDVPEGDVLIHCGDFTVYGNVGNVSTFGAWLKTLPHAQKIVIPGNHDEVFWREPQAAREALGDGKNGVTYLQDAGTTISGLQIYGCPWQPRHGPIPPGLRSGQAREQWTHHIPDACDILITHGPPHGILDAHMSESLGCDHLLQRVRQIKPLIHAFGHIHSASGIETSGDTVFINAAAFGHKYQIENPCRVIDVDVRTRQVIIAEEDRLVA